jgi:Family of unknown function (DUF5329)
MKTIVSLVLVLFSTIAFAGDIGNETEKEIAHLLTYLKNSTCQFYRNGTWYSPGKAVEHIERKYKWLKDKGLIDTTEEFIDRAASKSSISGNPYLVRCGNINPVKSSAWFKEELENFRK